MIRTLIAVTLAMPFITLEFLLSVTVVTLDWLINGILGVKDWQKLVL